MTTVSGSNVKFALKKETVYGTAPSGNWNLVPLIGLDLAPKTTFGEANLLGLGGDASRKSRDLTETTGTITVPIDVNNIGWWLQLVLGAPATSGTAPNFIHTFNSGAASLPSFALEAQHPDASTALFERWLGIKGKSIQFELGPTGKPQMRIDVSFLTNVKATSTAAGTPTAAAVRQFNQKENYLKKDGTALGRVLSATFPYNLNADDIRYVGGGGLIGDTLPGQRTFSGEVRATFDDWSLFTLASAGTLFKLAMGWSVDANTSLDFLLESAEFGEPSKNIGPGRIEAVFPLEASRDATLGRIMTVVLKNAITTYA